MAEVLAEFVDASRVPDTSRYTRGASWEEGNTGDGLSVAGFKDSEFSHGTKWLRSIGEFGFEDTGSPPYRALSDGHRLSESGRVSAYFKTAAGIAARKRAAEAQRARRAAERRGERSNV